MLISVNVNTDNTRASIEALKAKFLASAESAARAGANVIVEAAKQVVPVLTGRLQTSIHSELVGQDSTHVSMVIKPDTPYAVIVEFGTSRTKRPEPYMQIAYDSSHNEATLAAVDVVLAAIK